MSIEDFSSESVLFATFDILNERHRVYFRRGSLIWALETGLGNNKIVPVRDIISVDYIHDRSCSCKTVAYAGADNEAFQGPAIPPPRHDKLVVNFVVITANNVLRPNKVIFRQEDPKTVDTFVQTIQTALDELRRPKKFLVFVNPLSGNRRGERIYRKSVEPILQLANVKTKLVVTQHADHSKEFIMSEDLKQFDAILTVGGDGTLSEVINALVRRESCDSGLENNSDLDKLLLQIPLAVIPGGSTDCIAYTMNGTLDRKTAAFYAVLGETAGLDVCSVSSLDRGLLKCFVSCLGYGFLGDVLETSENYRWMGPKRYDFSGFLKVVANRFYHCELTMTLDASLPACGPVCYRDCYVCESSKMSERKIRYQEKALATIRSSIEQVSSSPVSSPSTSSNDSIISNPSSSKTNQIKISGRYFWVTCANISCACVKCPVGVAPMAHLGDGAMDILLIKPRSPLDVLRLLIRSTSKDPTENLYELPFVDVYKVNEFEFRALNRDQSLMNVDPDTAQGVASSVWNCDGEIIRESNVRVKNHRQLIRVLTRGKLPPTKSGRSMCFRCTETNADYVT